MKKGFTLIELLAVIVILAIIAIIAVPIVLNIIQDSKESAVFRSAEFYTAGVKNAVATSILNNKQINNGTYAIMKNGNVCLGTYDKEKNTCAGEELEIQVKGEKPTSGNITIKDGQINKVILNISDKEIIINSKGEFDYYLAPGLYDENDVLLASWDVLEEKYNISGELEYGAGSVANIIGQFDNASKIILDESVTSIGMWAFRYCTSLTEVVIPDSVILIEVDAFMDCPNLTSIKVDENNPVYDSRDNSNAIIETATNTLIAGCKNTVIPNSVMSIGDWAFSGCTDLNEISIPNSVTSIGNWAFSGCTSLTKINIPDEATSIGTAAFENCTSLTLISIPNSVTSIGNWAFSDCKSLKSISIPGSVKSIEGDTFNGSGLTEIIIQNGVEKIENMAFLGCSITSITIPNSVISIGSWAFPKSLTEVIIQNSETSISYQAFDGCSNLKKIYYKGNIANAPWGAPNAEVIR